MRRCRRQRQILRNLFSHCCHKNKTKVSLVFRQQHANDGVLSRLWVCGRAGGLDIPCPPCFLLATKMNVTVGHKAHVFASHVHFCGSYPDGGTLGYQAQRHGPTPKAEKEPKGSGKSKSVRSDAAAGYHTDFLKPAEKHETVDNSCF